MKERAELLGVSEHLKERESCARALAVAACVCVCVCVIGTFICGGLV